MKIYIMKKINEWSDLQLTDFIVEEGILTEKQFNDLSPTREQMIKLIENALKNIE